MVLKHLFFVLALTTLLHDTYGMDEEDENIRPGEFHFIYYN